LPVEPTHAAMKILVCEDDEVVLKVIQIALQTYNTEATYCKDGRQALEHLRAGSHFDLVITDIHMPYHNGDEILALIREEQKKTTPIIMISSDTEEEVIALALKSGVTAFIEKPLDPKKLNKLLKKFLS
jgi:DNA-binding response OmpR family regulator